MGCNGCLGRGLWQGAGAATGVGLLLAAPVGLLKEPGVMFGAAWRQVNGWSEMLHWCMAVREMLQEETVGWGAEAEIGPGQVAVGGPWSLGL